MVQITRYEQLQRRVGVHMAQALVGPGGAAVWGCWRFCLDSSSAAT